MQSPAQSRVGLTLRPGQRGTKKLVKRFGDDLLCVRYRYDEATGKRFKTVELILEEKEWEPSAAAQATAARRRDEAIPPEARWPEQHLVTVEVPATRSDLHEQMRAIGARPERHRPDHWRLPFADAIRLRLRKFIQTSPAARSHLSPRALPAAVEGGRVMQTAADHGDDAEFRVA